MAGEVIRAYVDVAKSAMAYTKSKLNGGSAERAGRLHFNTIQAGDESGIRRLSDFLSAEIIGHDLAVINSKNKIGKPTRDPSTDMLPKPIPKENIGSADASLIILGSSIVYFMSHEDKSEENVGPLMDSATYRKAGKSDITLRDLSKLTSFAEMIAQSIKTYENKQNLPTTVLYKIGLLLADKRKLYVRIQNYLKGLDFLISKSQSEHDDEFASNLGFQKYILTMLYASAPSKSDSF